MRIFYLLVILGLIGFMISQFRAYTTKYEFLIQRENEIENSCKIYADKICHHKPL